MYNLSDRSVVLGVTGSIAAYKAADLASKLTQAGALVDVVMTDAATRFITPLTFYSLTGRQAHVDMFDTASGAAEVHVELARRADVLAIVPATATTIARLALGLADDMVSLTALATKAPIVVCPAMDSQMWEHEATQTHVDTLKRRGVLVVGPEVGRLASGHVGAGRLAEPDTIVGAVRYLVGKSKGDLLGWKIVVSAGGTREPIDPVRYVGNYSSGKMGYAVAEAARDRGAEVTLVSAASLPAPFGVNLVLVQRAEEMREAVARECEGADGLVMAAAVADYQPAAAAGHKMKRTKAGVTLELVATPDILAEVAKADRLVRVGFAAESQDLVVNAREKLRAKGLHLIVANDITAAGSVFGSDMNQVVVLDRDGGQEELPLLPKYEVARRILDRVAALLAK